MNVRILDCEYVLAEEMTKDLFLLLRPVSFVIVIQLLLSTLGLSARNETARIS
jgi:hypothetical protein